MRFLRGLVSFQGTASRRKLFLIVFPITFLLLLSIFFEFLLSALGFNGCTKCVSPERRTNLIEIGHQIHLVGGFIYFLLLFFLYRIFHLFRKPRGLPLWPLYVMGVSFALFHASKWVSFYLRAGRCGKDCDYLFYYPEYEQIATILVISSFLSFLFFLLLLLILSAFKR